MESLRIKNNDLYRIEVNDNGEYIEFDLSDIGLKIKCFESLQRIEEIAKEYRDKFEFIDNEKDYAFIEKEMFEEMRKTMDNFLGENACQKIFGDRNYYSMFDDLINELSKKRPELGGKSHLDKLGFEADKIKEKVIKKYNKNAKNVI